MTLEEKLERIASSLEVIAACCTAGEVAQKITKEKEESQPAKKNKASKTRKSEAKKENPDSEKQMDYDEFITQLHTIMSALAAKIGEGGAQQAVATFYSITGDRKKDALDPSEYPTVLAHLNEAVENVS